MSRTVTLKREKRFWGSAVKWSIFIDGKYVGNISNGQELSIPISNGLHTVYWEIAEMAASGGTQTVRSEVIHIPEDGDSFRYRLITRIGMFQNTYTYYEE